MGNKLKSVFSDQEISFGGKINFKDQESYRQFLVALETVQEEGRAVQVGGINSVETLVRNGEMEYPIEGKNNICDFIMAPSTDEVSFKLKTDYGEREFVLRRYRVNKGVFLQTSEDAIVFLKIFLEKDTMKTTLNYHVQLENAKSVKEVIESYSIVLSFFNKLFKEDIKKSKGSITINTIKEYFEKLIEQYKKLVFVENEFGVAFTPGDLTQNGEAWEELEEMYLILKEKKVIRMNAKVNDSEAVGMKVSQQVDWIKVGDALDITFVRNREYSLWNINITLYTAILLSNAIVKKISEAGDGEIKILYGSEDSRPTFLSYKGFKTEEEANEEMKNIMNHKEDYTNALTVAGHINKKISR